MEAPRRTWKGESNGGRGTTGEALTVEERAKESLRWAAATNAKFGEIRTIPKATSCGFGRGELGADYNAVGRIQNGDGGTACWRQTRQGDWGGEDGADKVGPLGSRRERRLRAGLARVGEKEAAKAKQAGKEKKTRQRKGLGREEKEMRNLN